MNSLVRKTASTGLNATSAFRAAQRRNISFLDQFLQQKNTILEKQKAIQGDSTPYLRGAADPTYLRRPADKIIIPIFASATAIAWVAMGYFHYKMWTK